jgi:hypothetical protein
MLRKKPVVQEGHGRNAVEAALFASEVMLAQATGKLSRLDGEIRKAYAALGKARNPLEVVVALEKARGERLAAQADLDAARAQCLVALTRCWQTAGRADAAQAESMPAWAIETENARRNVQPSR